MSEKSRCALYCRLSKEDVNKEGENSKSILNQEVLLTAYAQAHAFDVVQVYKDDDFSGLYDDRPGFEKMIHDAQAGKFRIILAKSQSRFTRNMEHLEKYIHHLLPLWGIRFIGVVDGVDTGNKASKKTRQINGLVNEWYSEDLSESIKAGNYAMMKQGKFIGAAPPYGYLKDPKDHCHLIPDPYAACVVKRIFQMYISGIGKAKIGRILSEEGILIPSIYKRKILGLHYQNANAKETTFLWTFQTISGILDNEVYLGHLIQNKEKTLSYKDRRKIRTKEEERIRVDNTHEPIIDRETFEMARQIKKEKRLPVKIEEKKTPFSRMLFCPDCKKAMVRYYSKKRKDGSRETMGFVCRTYKAHGNRFCTSHLIQEKILHDVVLKCLKEEAKKQLDEQAIQNLKKMEWKKQQIEYDMQLEQLEEEGKRFEKYRLRLYEDYVDEVLTKTEYTEKKGFYEEKILLLQRQMENLKKQMHRDQEPDALSKWIEKFRDYINIEELTYVVTHELIDRIYIYENKEIRIVYKFHGESLPET